MIQQFQFQVYTSQKSTETLIWKDLCIPMLKTANVLKSQVKEATQMPINGWMNRKELTHTHTQEYYSAIKKNKNLLFTSMWLDLEGIMLS